MCSTDISSVTTDKVYTRKDLVLLETSISQFPEKYYTPETQKLAFHFPHVRILGTHHCGKERHKAFKFWSKEHDILCRSDYA